MFVPRETSDKSKRANYIFAITPVTLSVDEEEKKISTVNTIKKTITTTSMLS